MLMFSLFTCLKFVQKNRQNGKSGKKKSNKKTSRDWLFEDLRKPLVTVQTIAYTNLRYRLVMLR